MPHHLDRQARLTRNQWRIIATANLGDMLVDHPCPGVLPDDLGVETRGRSIEEIDGALALPAPATARSF